MDEDLLARLREKKWHANALRARIGLRQLLAEALKKEPACFEFSDYMQTRQIGELFASNARAGKRFTAKDRDVAMQLVTEHFGDNHQEVYILEDGYEEAGVILLACGKLGGALANILRLQHESLRVMSLDGAVGACVSVEEGTDPHFPRHVIIW